MKHGGVYAYAVYLDHLSFPVNIEIFILTSNNHHCLIEVYKSDAGGKRLRSRQEKKRRMLSMLCHKSSIFNHQYQYRFLIDSAEVRLSI